MSVEHVWAQTNPTEVLQRAKAELERVSTVGADQNSKTWIEILKRDFAELQSSYADQASSSKDEASSASAYLRDWRIKYASVASDLVSLDDAMTSVSRQLRTF